jgi:hypothetical protein
VVRFKARIAPALRRHVIGHLTSASSHRPHLEKILEKMVNANCATHVGCAGVPELLPEIFVFPVT